MKKLTRFFFKGYTLIFLLGAAIFMIMLAADITCIGRTMAKAVPVSTLLVLVILNMKGFARIFLAGALIGSVTGDILLDLPHDTFFIFGLGAFLAGHVFYTIGFYRYARRPDRSEAVTTAALIVFAGAMIWLFSGIDPELYGPVVIYIIVIVAMSIGALLVPAPDRFLFYGAALFIASDLVLAINKFLISIPAGRLINISLYFAAQYIMIAAALTIWNQEKKSDP
jgi:uncharacterized membrane protein YhhN